MTTLKELNCEFWQMQGIHTYEILDVQKIGIGVIYNIDYANKRAAINVWMDDWENRIQARTATVLLMNTIFEKMCFEKAECYYCASDRYRRRIFNNLRFTTDGKLRNHFLKGNRYETVISMSILRHEYERFFHNEKRVRELIYELPV